MGEPDHPQPAGGELGGLCFGAAAAIGWQRAAGQYRLSGTGHRQQQAVAGAPGAAGQPAGRVERERGDLLAGLADSLGRRGGGQLGLDRLAGLPGPARRLAGQRGGQYDVPVAVDPGQLEPVAGQGTGLVGDHDGDRAERLPGAQPAQQRAAAGQLAAVHREQHGDQDRQLLRDGSEGDRQPVQQHLVPASAGQ